MGIPSHSEFKQGWTLLLITLIGTTTSASYIPLYSFGPLAQDLSTALNVSLSDIQKIITFNFVGIAIGSQLAGWLVERYNPRHIILCSLLFLCSKLYLARHRRALHHYRVSAVFFDPHRRLRCTDCVLDPSGLSAF